MPISPGHELAHYEILEPIGKGGMGEVYRAKDGKLGRDVAIKVLPNEFAQDEERLRRFQREAKVLASLNHPNIASIYGLEQSGETHYLVLELVPGETLAERIARGPIPVEETLEIAKKIAEALEEAHEQGIVHRDLKPANVKLTPDEKVKVLDFGLAKAFTEDASDADSSMSPTITRGTQVGVILGTAAYMSPEQAKGKRVDKRTDVFAFGAVLFEMLTGQRAFPGEDISETLAYVLTREPDWDALPDSTPAPLSRALRVCLTKDPKRRARDIADVQLAIDGVFETQAKTPPSSPLSTRHFLWIVVVGTLASAATIGLVLSGMKAPPSSSTTRLIATPPGANIVAIGPPDVDIAIAPDGERIVYASTLEGRRHLFVRALDELEATAIDGLGNNPRNPFISPEGAWIGYFDGSSLKKVSSFGGPPVTIWELQGGGRGASWGLEDTIIFGVGGFGGLRSVSAGGGEPEAFTEPPPGVSHRWPEILPGNRAVLFSVHEQSLQNSSIAVVPFDGGEPKILVPGGSNPRYAPTGHIVYGVNGTLRAVGFDLDRLEVTTDPVPVVDGVVTKATGAVDFGIARGGSLLYVAGSPMISQRLLAWVQRDGSVEFLDAPPRAYMYPRISPDGTRVALDVRDQEHDIWIYELERESLSRLTLDPANDNYPVWSADGARVAFASWRAGRRASIFWRNADGTGAGEQLVDGDLTQSPRAFSPDGRLLVYQEIAAQSSDIHVLNLDDGTKTPIIASDFEERNPELSRDGRWIAFESEESGQPEVYVHPFPNTDEGRWKISTAGGTRPLWGPDDSELFYLTEDGTLMTVAVQTQPEFTVGDAEVLLEGVYLQGPPGRVYDLHPDGERFLIIKVPGYEEASSKPSLILVQNWFEELKRLVPTDN